MQAVVATVFMERHWQMVTRRLADAVTGDIAAIIDLIAVAAPFRRQGIAGQMIEAAFDHFGDTIDGIRVGTQEDNLASMRLYERAGFAVERRDVTLHWVNPKVAP